MHIFMKLVNGANATSHTDQHLMKVTKATGGVVQVNWKDVFDGTNYDFSHSLAQVNALDNMGLEAALLINTSAKQTPTAVMSIPGLNTITLLDASRCNSPITVPDFWNSSYQTALLGFAAALGKTFGTKKNLKRLVVGFGTKYPEPDLVMGTHNSCLVTCNSVVQDQSKTWADFGLTAVKYGQLLVSWSDTLKSNLPLVQHLSYPFHIVPTGFLGDQNRFDFPTIMLTDIHQAPTGGLAIAQLSNLSLNTPTLSQAQGDPDCSDTSKGKYCGELLLPTRIGMPLGFEFVGPAVNSGGTSSLKAALAAAETYNPPYTHVYPEDFTGSANQAVLLHFAGLP